MKTFGTGLTIGVLLLAVTGWAKTVGVYQPTRGEPRPNFTPGILDTMRDAGWQVVVFSDRADLADTEKLEACDVVYLTSGWNALNYADFKSRRALTRFVASGKGLLLGGFRSGYVRTLNRPIFPEIGASHNRLNSPYIFAHGDSPLAQAIDKPFSAGDWDHLVLQTGPLATVFAADVDGAPIGATGEIYGGRVVVFGAKLITVPADAKMEDGPARRLMLAMLDWLGKTTKRSEQEITVNRLGADLAFLRREIGTDWFRNTRGSDSGPGVLAGLHRDLAYTLESRLYMLHYQRDFLAGGDRSRCEAAVQAMDQAVTQLNRTYDTLHNEMTHQFARMTVEELTVDHPELHASAVAERVRQKLAPLFSDEKALSKRVREAVGSHEAVIKVLYADDYRERLFAKADLKKVVASVDQTIAALRPAVQKAKESHWQQEREADHKTVPARLAECRSPDRSIRFEACRELGRIGDPRGEEALLALLKDPDEKVQIQAILGLGWMQSKRAVPDLIELADGDNRFLRRRALQMLGQIGDPRASDVAMKRMNDADPATAENAILALGQLKAQQAVTALLKVVQTGKADNGYERARMMTALRALGNIGDGSDKVMEVLDAAIEHYKDFPFARNRPKVPINDYYSTPQELGVGVHAQMAKARIAAGGLKEPGFKQADALARQSNFYGLTRNFNMLAGTINAVLNTFEEPEELLPYLWEAGVTAINWTWRGCGYGNPVLSGNPERLIDFIQAAGDVDIRWIDILPEDRHYYSFTRYPDSRQHGVDKAGGERVLMRHADTPNFQGFWSEEVWPGALISEADLAAWLTSKYGADFRKQRNIPEDAALLPLSKIDGEQVGVLVADYHECAADVILEPWRETQEWLHGMRKGCAFTYNITTRYNYQHINLLGRAGGTIDAIGPEDYESFGRVNAFYLEMYKDGEARPSISEFYNWYGRTPETDARGFAQHLMHGECFHQFALEQIFRYPTGNNWAWDETRWETLRKIFQRARTIKDYIAVPQSAATAAVVLSERTPQIAAREGGRTTMETRYEQQQTALWTALHQVHVPADVIWAETLTPEKLGRYDTLVLADARNITSAQADLLRDWVKAGGVLIVTGLTSLYNDQAEVLPDYRLADLIGASFIGYVDQPDPAKIDTEIFNLAKLTTAYQSSGFTRSNLIGHVVREIKPVSSIVTYMVLPESSVYLANIPAGAIVEYDLPLGYAQVKLADAKPLAAFANGDAALTVNEIGQGLVYFWTPVAPGLCHVARDWEMHASRKYFWPNVLELFGGMVKGGLAKTGKVLPVVVTGMDKEIEVTLRKQPEHNRMMIHLLNYDATVNRVPAAQVTIHPPTGKSVKRVFYPDTDTEVAFTVAAGGVTAPLRQFEVHDLIVVEWNP